MEKNDKIPEISYYNGDPYRDVSFNYSIQSTLADPDCIRCNREVILEINLRNGRGDTVEKIGQVNFSVLYIDSVREEQKKAFYIERNGDDHFTNNHFDKIFNSDDFEFTQPIQDKYSHDLLGMNTCLIENVFIYPKFRGHQLALKAIKDIIFTYLSSCTLFIMHPKALQHDPHNIFVEREGLGLEKFNESEEDASTKIQSYFEGMGFEIIPGIPDLLFFNTAMRNDKLEAIDMDKAPDFDLKENKSKKKAEKKGIKKGEKLAKLKFIENLLVVKRFSDQQIVDYTEAKPSVVKKVKEKLIMSGVI